MSSEKLDNLAILNMKQSITAAKIWTTVTLMTNLLRAQAQK